MTPPIQKSMQPEVKAGIFIAIGVSLVLFGILLLGGGESIFSSSYRLKAGFEDVSGLSKGSYVRSGGISVGRVTRIDFDADYRRVMVTMLIKDEFRQRIKKDSKVQMLTQGMLGDKYLEISDGSADATPADKDSVLETKGPEGLAQMLKGGENVINLLEKNLVNLKKITDSFAQDQRSDKFFKSLTEATTNLNTSLENLNKGKGLGELNAAMKNLRIMTDRINNGEGTVGALLNDSSLYEDLKLLIGGASRNRVLQFFVKQAVKTSDDAKQEKSEKSKKGSGKDPASTGEMQKTTSASNN